MGNFKIYLLKKYLTLTTWYIPEIQLYLNEDTISWKIICMMKDDSTTSANWENYPVLGKYMHTQMLSLKKL
jgi:hypothetical protein